MISCAYYEKPSINERGKGNTVHTVKYRIKCFTYTTSGVIYSGKVQVRPFIFSEGFVTLGELACFGLGLDLFSSLIQ